MTNNALEKSQMGAFIQGLYGVVLGVSLASLKIKWDTVTSVRGIKPVSERFQFFLILFTTVITAHDWFIYHIKLRRDLKQFKNYLVQIGSLFFLALMFDFSSFSTMFEWYCAALGYTVFNIISMSFDPHKKVKPQPYFKYIAHLSITIIPIFARKWIMKEIDISESWFYTVYLGLTIIIVIALWIILDPRAIKKEQELLPKRQPLNISFLDLYQLKPAGSLTHAPDPVTLVPNEKFAILTEIKNKTDKDTIISNLKKDKSILDADKREPLFTKYITGVLADLDEANSKHLDKEIAALDKSTREEP